MTIVIDAENAAIDQTLNELGLPYDDTLVLHREINTIGKNLCRINGTVVPLSSLSRLSRLLADIHGQYDHQSLLDTENHIELLDLYGKKDISEARESVDNAYRAYIRTEKALENLLARKAESERQKDLLAFELQEIQEAAIMPGEDETLEEEIHMMQNSEKIFDVLSSSHTVLFAQDQSAVTLIGKVFSDIRSIESYSSGLKKFSETIGDIYYSLDDVVHELRGYADSIDFSPEVLDEKILRLDSIERLKRKYGGTLASVLDHAEQAERDLALIEQADTEIVELQQNKEYYLQKLKTVSAQLHDLRTLHAAALSAQIESELKELHFHNAVFKIQITECDYSSTGADRVEFLISANLGEAPKSLASIASGGELSRIMLAMKRIIGGLDRIPTMIFDEIDTGISGATAGIVGKKLLQISYSHQVICITHLPQIAAHGYNHYRIEKISDEISTHTTVAPLNEIERVEEIARLLSGTEITEAARKSAQELLMLSHCNSGTMAAPV